MMNDKTKLVKEAKNDKASRCCWSAYQKRLGKMGLGEMLPNHTKLNVTFTNELYIWKGHQKKKTLCRSLHDDFNVKMYTAITTHNMWGNTRMVKPRPWAKAASENSIRAATCNDWWIIRYYRYIIRQLVTAREKKDRKYDNTNRAIRNKTERKHTMD